MNLSAKINNRYRIPVEYLDFFWIFELVLIYVQSKDDKIVGSFTTASFLNSRNLLS